FRSYGHPAEAVHLTQIVREAGVGDDDFLTWGDGDVEGEGQRFHGAEGDHHVLRPEAAPPPAGVLLCQRLPQFGGAGVGDVAGVVVLDAADAGGLDVLGRGEVRFSDRELHRVGEVEGEVEHLADARSRVGGGQGGYAVILRHQNAPGSN